MSENELSSAINFREVGKYQESQKWLNQFLKTNPNNPEALSLLSHVLLLDNKDLDAEKILSKAIALKPNLPSVQRNSVRLLLKQNKFSEALKKAHIIYEKSPDDKENCIVSASCLVANHKDEEALVLIEKVLNSIPNYADALAIRGIIRIRAKDIEGSIKDLEMTLALKPHLSQLWFLLSRAHNDFGNTETAIKDAKKACELEPTNANFKINLGEFLKAEGKFLEAINILKEAIKLDPENTNILITLGLSYQLNGQINDAVITYEKALKINPKISEALSNLGVIARSSEEWDSALEYFEKALKISPNMPEIHNNKGITLKDLNRLNEAEESYNKAIELNPDYAEAYSNLGLVLKSNGKMEKAIVNSKKAINLNSNIPDLFFNLSITLYANGDFNSALKNMEKAQSKDPKSKKYKLFSAVIKEKITNKHLKENNGVIRKSFNARLTSNPLILKRKVESRLISTLYNMNSRTLEETTDARYGKGLCSSDFSFFENENPAIKTLEKDLTDIMMNAVKSDIYIYDSFFNILSSGGGTTPHMHLNSGDLDTSLNLFKRKYSLVYYLSVGDQNCSDPGILKIYDPNEDILPSDGMIVIIPSDRKHSSVYNGRKDRIMIGVNFYSL